MLFKQIISFLAIVITFLAFLPYLRSILKDTIQPHVFSWVIWGATTFIVFLAQLDDGGGVGAWPIGVSGCITLLIALLAYIKRTDIEITKLDWLFFVVAISSLPFWYFTSDPLWAVVILTIVDVLGFGPTLRKAYVYPYSESLLFYSLFVIRNVLVIIALENYSITTTLFPAVIAVVSSLLVFVIFYRRRVT